MSQTLLGIFQRKLDYVLILLTRVHKKCNLQNIHKPKSAALDLYKIMKITNYAGNVSFAVCDTRF